MKFFGITPEGSTWYEAYDKMPIDESYSLPGSIHTDADILFQVQKSGEPISSPEISSNLRRTEDTYYSVGDVNLSLRRLERKGLVFGQDWG